MNSFSAKSARVKALTGNVNKESPVFPPNERALRKRKQRVRKPNFNGIYWSFFVQKTSLMIVKVDWMDHREFLWQAWMMVFETILF